MESAKGAQVKKVKKKQVKDELDRIKQAEKKRRRLEKALATSAAIRSDLEKKKQQKKEEQERLDEEGAAIAEAVALHVLLGEDSDDPRIVLKEGPKYNLGDWHHAPNIELFMDKPTLPRQSLKRCSFENVGRFSGGYGYGCEWNHFREFDQPFKKNTHLAHFEDEAWNHDDFSAGLIAAQAVGALRIGENVQVDVPVFFNRY